MEWFVNWFWWFGYLVEGFEEGWVVVLGYFVVFFNDVVVFLSVDWDDWEVFVVEYLKEFFNLFGDLFEFFFVVVDYVYFVDGNYDVVDIEGFGKEGVFFGLWYDIVGSGDDEDSCVGLVGIGDYVFNEVFVIWSVDDGDVFVWGFEFGVGDVDGDIVFFFFFEFVYDLSEFEGFIFFIYFFEFFDDVFWDVCCVEE